MDWQKLINDLIESNKAAKDAAAAVSDGGSANLDSVFLRIPRQQEIKVLKAIQEAGLYCRCKRQWIGQGYMITPTCGGMADKRYKAVIVMVDELKARGWDAIAYRQVD
ncbi:hypothetical protein [Paenibacillus taiwanensis]|uniref:hypothetical protein n=1 Tax=Paenibacillus taiwanensis TaxID=401638 RepID=UPI000403E2E3|nr:hypothetical protein [Paenibacillus taiwanensis]